MAVKEGGMEDCYEKGMEIINSAACLPGHIYGMRRQYGDGEDSAKGVKMYLTVSSADTFRQNLIDSAEKTAKEMGAEFTASDAEGLWKNSLRRLKRLWMEAAMLFYAIR